MSASTKNLRGDYYILQQEAAQQLNEVEYADLENTEISVKRFNELELKAIDSQLMFIDFVVEHAEFLKTSFIEQRNNPVTVEKEVE